MAATFPYAHVACPCTSLTTGVASSTVQQKRSSHQSSLDTTAGDITTDTFNPHDPRANYSLYPYDQLLYCDECHQIRCPRCWADEIMNWYCPTCLFEVPSSVVKSDGNRCTRHCYNCPLCTAPLFVNGLDQQSKDHLSPQDAVHPSGPFYLSCLYCDWTTLDSGIQFSKPTKITEQISRLRGRHTSPNRSRASLLAPDASTSNAAAASVVVGESGPPRTVDDKFSALSSFYKTQQTESAGLSSNPMLDSNFNSPNNLARIMSLYGGLSYTALKKSREKPQPMREALTPAEGLQLLDLEDDHAETIEKLRTQGHSSVASRSQRTTHPFNHTAKFTTDLWPIATALRTRRSKRCRTCRHILTKPEPKIGSTRYKIRLLAQNHIPRLSLNFLSQSNSASSISTPASAAFALTASSVQSFKDSEYERLRPMLPVQYLLTLTNPLFDAVRVTLATPSTTPGPVASRVTILCPSFEIGAAGDLWDEALNGTGAGSGGTGGSGGGTSQSQRPTSSKDSSGRDPAATGEERQPEAGKVWERGRNWTSVVMEVVPGTLSAAGGQQAQRRGAAKAEEAEEAGDDEWTIPGGDAAPVDEDVLEIPVFVRVEWEAEVTAEDAAANSDAVKGTRQSRELAFWTILGAGRIAG